MNGDPVDRLLRRLDEHDQEQYTKRHRRFWLGVLVLVTLLSAAMRLWEHFR